MSRPRVLLVVLSDSGHVNPMIGVAQELERAGAEVAFFSCQDDVSGRVERAGLAARCFVWKRSDPSAEAGTSADATHASVLFTRRRRNKTWLRIWLSQVLLDQLPAQVAALRAVVADVRPDAIGVDAMAYPGAVVGETAQIPWASVATALVPLTPPAPAFSSPWNDVFGSLDGARASAVRRESAQLEFVVSDVVSPWLNVVFTLAGFAQSPPPSPSGVGVHLVGPAVTTGARGDERPFPWERLPPDRPIVYASFGSIAAPEPAVYEELLRCFEPEEAHLVLTAKELARDATLASAPAHVTVVDYAPQLAVLARASAMITHGGYNSVTECVVAATPMLVVPLLYDQPLNAHFVTRAGVGRTLELAALTRESVRAAVLPMLGSGAAERARVQTLSEAYRASNGSRRAAELLVHLAKNRRPLPAEPDAREVR